MFCNDQLFTLMFTILKKKKLIWKLMWKCFLVCIGYEASIVFVFCVVINVSLNHNTFSIWGLCFFLILFFCCCCCCCCCIAFTHSQIEYFLTLPPWTNGRHFADDISRCIFVNEKFCNLIKISLKFAPVDSNSALVQIMAWHRIGHMPLSEAVLTRFISH